MSGRRQTYLATGKDSAVPFQVPPEAYGDDLERVTISFKSLQITGPGNVAVRLRGDEDPPTYFMTCVDLPDGAARPSNAAFLSRLNGAGEGLHGHMLLTRNHSSGATDVWVASWTFRRSQGGLIIGAGNTYFFGRLSRIVVGCGERKFASGNIGVLYG